MADMDGTDPAPGEPDGIRIVSPAGAGGRSQWFRAEQVRLNRIVALKRLRPEFCGSPVFREAFIDAGRQAASIVHPAALPIINVFPKQCCIAVQWCRGPSLRALPHPLDALSAARIGEAVMDCLSSLHATGRSHGNLAPGNIFLDESGGVWLDDFFQPPSLSDGAAALPGEEDFLAPEWADSGILDWRVDVFALSRVLRAVTRRDGLPREFASLLDAMQSPEPSRRGESPNAVWSALRRARVEEEARMGLEQGVRRARRRYRRVPAEFEVSMQRRSPNPVETAVLLMKIRDIGESGVFVETDDDLIVVGSVLELDITLRGVTGRVHALGIVRWKSAPPMPKGVGVQFTEVDQAGLANLRKFLENR